MTMANPPSFPQAYLDLIVPPDAREAVSGDLLEEYRAARVPALGRRRADLWYWRQVGGIWLRAYWWFVVPFVLFLVVEDLFNTFRAPSGASYLDLYARNLLAPSWWRGSPLVVGMAIFGLAGAYGSWRTHRWEGGFVAAVGTCSVVWLFATLWSTATLYPFAQVQQANPYWIQAWHWSTARTHSDATFLRWMIADNFGGLLFAGLALLSLAGVCGGIGSALGLLTIRRPPTAIHEEDVSAR